MVAREHLLTSLQMANFVADGFLRFDELVPAHLNAAAVAEMESDVIEPMKRGPGATLDKARPTLAPDIPAGLLLVANCDLIRIRRVARRRRSWQQVGYSRAT